MVNDLGTLCLCTSVCQLNNIIKFHNYYCYDIFTKSHSINTTSNNTIENRIVQYIIYGYCNALLCDALTPCTYYAMIFLSLYTTAQCIQLLIDLTTIHTYLE